MGPHPVLGWRDASLQFWRFSMVWKILGGLIALILVFFLVASFQPADFKISRSILVAAPAKACFEQVNDFHKWENWSPWAKMDPGMQTAYDGSAFGTGAVYSWTGSGKVGAGMMTLFKSEPYRLIDIQLDFIKPMKTTSLTEFTFGPEGKDTRVTWAMSGQKNLAAKAFHMVVNMDKLIGPDFEEGLAQLKAQAEAVKEKK
jgi:hypothetical protein